ncbi:MAG: hypothetical protein OQK24_04270 [Magnetovibrio sp.]|nr:hypothetical protein [Magnetovibrio sp.]
MTPHIQIGNISPRVQYEGDGMQTEFVYLFQIFADADMEVYLDDTLQSSGYSISGAGQTQGGAVTMDSAPLNGVVVTLARRLPIQRTTDFLESGEFRAKIINDELDYLTASLQQVTEDQSRSAQMAITLFGNVDTTLPTPQANSALVWNDTANGFVNGPTVSEISNAEGYAADALVSKNSALASASSASNSATAAASSATAAQTAAASNMYSSNESKTIDFDVLTTDDGKQFLIDTSSGNVTVTLPEGSLLTDGFRIALGKTSADNNAVIVNRSGTDTINGGTTWQFSSPHGQSVITVDTTPSPDTWFAAGVGVMSPVGVSDLHDNARPYDIAFVAGYDGTMAAEDIAVQTYGELVVPRAFTLTGEQLYMDIPPAGSEAIFDIEKNGTSVYSTKPQVAVAANAGTAGVLSETSIAAGDRLTFKCTQVGSTVAGGGVRFTLAGKLS